MSNGSKAVITDGTCCFFVNDRLTDMFFYNKRDVECGDIYVGRVSNVKPDLGAAFVDIKKDVTGFLPLSEVREEFLPSGKGLKQGDEIPVMVTALAQKKKPIALSTDISIHGLYSVAVCDRSVFVSSKLNKEEKDRLRDLVTASDPATGIIVRTAAAETNENELLTEISDLSHKLQDIIQTYRNRVAYSLLYAAKPSFYDRLCELKPEEIITDSPDIIDEAKQFVSDASKIQLYTDSSMPLFILYGFSKCKALATDRKVNLKSGGFLLIEPTETLTVIDVNSGKTDKVKNKRDLIRNTNNEAADEIFRQLRLRNISGIIIVDFINFDNDEDLLELTERLRKLSKEDPVKTRFIDMTKLGLAEITRQKKHESIYSYLGLNTKNTVDKPDSSC